MQKYVLGIIAVICLHIGFMAYISSDPALETARTRAPRMAPVAAPVLEPDAVDDQILIARGDAPAMSIDEYDVADIESDQPVTSTGATRSADRKFIAEPAPRVVRTVKTAASDNKTLYQNASYTVERTEFPGAVAATNTRDDDDDDYSAVTRSSNRSQKRSLLSKMGSIAKKPYDGLKAFASWLN